jgi:DNA-binding PadR family transcriptional regulator
MLEFAVLGLLAESPLHGYELRKRLNALLGTFRAFSYGSLYPTLRRMQASGWVTADSAGRGGQRKVVYSLTADGKERFAELLGEAGPSAWEDEAFGVHFAFFSKTSPEARMRILEGRRIRLEEKRERFRGTVGRARERVDRYTTEMHRHGLESVEREVRWLTELIETERTISSEAAAAAAAPDQRAPVIEAEHPLGSEAAPTTPPAAPSTTSTAEAS